MHGPHGALAVQHVLGGGDDLEVVNGMAQLVLLQHGDFRLRLRVAQMQADQEPVQLRLRQGKGPLVVNRVLGGDEKEGRGQIIIDAVGGDLAFGHGFEQGGLGARGGAVDFVGQDDLGEERAGAELELGRLRVEDGAAGDVVGQEVGGALQAFEGAAEAAGQGAGQHGFGHARNVLQQDVPLGQEGDQGPDNLVALADDDLPDIVNNTAGKGRDGRGARLAPGGVLLLGDPDFREGGRVQAGFGAAVGADHLAPGHFLGKFQVLAARDTSASGHGGFWLEQGGKRNHGERLKFKVGRLKFKSARMEDWTVAGSGSHARGGGPGD